MIILLDIDGVMVSGASWKPLEIMADGFPNFKFNAVNSLNRIISETHAQIVLTTTHRHKFSVSQWKDIFASRNVRVSSLSVIEAEVYSSFTGMDRFNDITNWVVWNQEHNYKYVIIDDDKSLNGLPAHIKKHLVLTDPIIGLNEEDAEEAIGILKGSSWGHNHFQ
jgi:hypothetical protein